MKKQIIILLLLAGGLASVSAKTEPIIGNEYPNGCTNGGNVICCATANGSVYYGKC